MSTVPTTCTVVAGNTLLSLECVIPNTLRMGQKKQFGYHICPISKCNGTVFSYFCISKALPLLATITDVTEREGLGSSESYLRGAASPHGGTAEVWGDGRSGFLSRQSVTQIETFFVLLFPFFQTSKVL